MSRHGVYDLKYGFLPDDDCPEKPPKKETNADRIRAMTDEELAKLLNDAESDGRVYGPKGKVAWGKWLRQECDPNE